MLKDDNLVGIPKTGDGKIVKAIRKLEALQEEQKIAYTQLELDNMKRE